MRRQPLPLDDAPGKPLPDSLRLVHELCVQQAELQAQNEELQRVQHALELARASYRDLYDFAPVGYCSVSVEGRVIQANLMFASLLESPRAALLQQPFSAFIQAADQDVYYRMHQQLLARQLVENELPSLSRMERHAVRCCHLHIQPSYQHRGDGLPGGGGLFGLHAFHDCIEQVGGRLGKRIQNFPEQRPGAAMHTGIEKINDSRS